MFRRISNSWKLVKASFNVLRADKELLIFPIVSGIASLIVLATFAIPMFLTGLLEGFAGDGNPGVRIVSYVVAFAFYFTQYFIIIFSNSAIVGAAMIRLKGGDPTVGDGFRIAFAHIGSILGYTFISATVGMILRWISGKGTLGQIVSSIIGLAWGLATYLVIPVLVIENTGPIEGIKRSTKMLKDTWGEQIVGNFGIGTITGLLTLVVIVVGAVLAFALFAAANSAIPLFIILAIVIVLVIAINLVGTALNGIYTAALYRYAVEGDTGGMFEKELIADSIRRK
jgi:Family of unknown function (DUF6159)